MSGNKHVLIVGGGIAGLSLAFYCVKNNISFKLLDSGINVSSKVAAGLVNPIVFRRMTKSWNADVFLPAAVSFYEEIGELLGKIYFHEIPIRRAFAHEQELDLWKKREEQEAYNQFITPLSYLDSVYDGVLNSFGTGVVKQSGYVETKSLLTDFSQWLYDKGFFEVHSFNYDDIDLVNTSYQGEAYRTIVFCQGYENKDNPWFSNLPIESTKGELLTIKSDQLSENESLNRKCFILPLGNKTFKVGSTYVWNTPNTDLTTEALQLLDGQLASLIKVPYSIVGQEAGIRPTVPDRRPILGRHPEYHNLAIFNGLGTKGYMLAPLLAMQLVAHLFFEGELDKEVLISRYF
jgi:glycine/D-amino acid oxidase-like deaminating enzyme